MDNQFYRAFEDRFRGSCELITERLRVYQPFLEALLMSHPEARAIDLGCGRGEWLDLITKTGIKGEGVDLNEAMLNEARKRGIAVHCEDALSFLGKQADTSIALISAFHFIEHIPFTTLTTVIKESLRVLQPGGLLIFETPNPENLLVGSSHFYLDPSHERPIPAPLLAFTTEYYGFEQVKILRLQENFDNRPLTGITLADVLLGSSSDYAIIAQKKPLNSDSPHMSTAFQSKYGASLDELAHAYHHANQLAMRDLIHQEIRVTSRIKHWLRRRPNLVRHIKRIRERLF